MEQLLSRGGGFPVWAALVVVASVSGVLVSTAIGPLAARAARIGLLDVPNGRKLHVISTPLVGGIALVILALCLLLVPAIAITASWMLFMAALMGVLGLVDDLTDLSARLRLGVQLVACMALASLPGWNVEVLGDVLGTGPIAFGAVGAVLFTSVCIVGVMNAVNMIDGIDGLSGSLCAMTLLFLCALALDAGRVAELLICASLFGGVVGFVICNLGLAGARRRVFLGDTGSMFLGFSLGAILVALSQGEDAAFRPIAAGWLLGLPIMDTVAVMVGRVLRGTSPFSPGRDHAHHLLMRAGLSSRETLVLVCIVHLAMISTGLCGEVFDVAPAILFWAFVMLTIAHFTVLQALARCDDVRLGRAVARMRAGLGADGSSA